MTTASNMTIDDDYSDIFDKETDILEIHVNIDASWRFRIILAYGLIVIVSLIGNLLICKIAFSGRQCGRQRRARTTDCLIGSLALSDLIISMFGIPLSVYRLLSPVSCLSIIMLQIVAISQQFK